MSTPVTSADAGANLDRDEMARRVQRETFAAFGEGFEPAYDFANTHERVQEALSSSRQDNPPEAINPWECRIGGSKFFIPPININVSSVFKSGNMTGAALRQQSAPKFNSGHTETVVSMTLYFASYEEIFGFEDEIFRINFDDGPEDLSQYHPSDRRLLAMAPPTNSDDESIDKFLSSLRGLIAQFRYAPFLPVRNAYLNRAFGITGVVLKDMSISTVPNYPFCLAVNLTMYKFNHKVYLPMIEHFDQAIHWTRFRQYMGRAAGRLAQASKPIQEFSFINTPDPGQIRPSVRSLQEILDDVHVQDIPSTQTYKRHTSFDSNMIEFWYPISTPARIDLPDLSDMRYSDIVFNQQRTNWWQRFLGVLGFDVNTDRDRYRRAREMAEENGTGFIVNQNEFSIFTAYMRRVALTANLMSASALNSFYEERLREEGIPPGTAEARELRLRVEDVWFYSMYRFFMEDPSLARAIANQDRRGRQLSINEWEVPMTPRNLDMDTVKIQGVSVTMGNVISRLQLQMQDEPTHQHIGGADTLVNISILIQGENAETELVKLRTMFEHISGLARLEHGHGVLGFLGIKNIITELVGMRYVIPLNFEVNTVPNYPHVYEVNLTLTDFDIFQQKRETLGAEQQAELAEAFGKRNPFFRIKQLWGMFNAYPDFPLSVRDGRGKIVGHLDPDFYFRSFKSLDSDIFLSEESQKFANIEPSQGADAIRRAVEELDRDAIQDAERKRSPSYNVMEGLGVHYCLGMGEGGSTEYCTIDDQGFSLFSDDEPFMINTRFNEPHAGNTIGTPETEGLTPPAGYVQPYLDNSGDPWYQFEAMSQDMLYRDTAGRMIRAFPTYMLWLIDEGGTFAGMKLFDNFYGLQSVIDMSIVQSEDILGDTLVLRVSNLYSKLSTKMNDMLEETNPGARIINQTTRWLHRRLSQGDYIVDLETMQLRPGIRLHLRLGYGANPNNLETVFNGTITEVHTGEIVTIVAQSDAMELGALVNSTNEKGHTGKIDGGMTGLYLSEPRDLMITLLTQGSTKVKEVFAHMTKGEIFSENRYGIRHFGTMFYQPLDGQERTRTNANADSIAAIIQENIESTAETSTDADDNMAFGSSISNSVAPGLVSMAMLDVMNAAWVNLAAKRDYEVFKRNIYPGNGTGIGQFHGGDIGEYGLNMAISGTGTMKADTSGQAVFEVRGGGQAALNAAVQLQETADDDVQSVWTRVSNRTATATALASPAMLMTRAASGGGNRVHNISRIFGIRERTDEGDGVFDEVSFRAQTYMKSVWDLFLVCAALLPDYIVAVRPFEDRSTIFYGKPHWLYTSGLIPLTTGLPPELGPSIEEPDTDMMKIFDEIEALLSANDELSDFEEMFNAVDRFNPTSSTGGISFTGDASGANLAARAALAAGFPEDEAIIMVAIAGAESNWTPSLNNAGMNRDGTTDYGMWQINRGAHGGWVDFSRITDPFYNAEVAYELVQRKKRAGNSKIYGDWAVHDHYSVPNAARGKYRNFLEPARQAVTQELNNSTYARGNITTSARYTAIANTYLDGNNKIDDIPVDFDAARESQDWLTASQVYSWQGKGRSDADAQEIWDEIKEFFPTDGETERVFMRSRQLQSLSEPERDAIKKQIFDDIVEGFINFMYSNPYARGWVVRTTNRRAGGFIVRAPERIGAALIDTITGILSFGNGTDLNSQANRRWEFGPTTQCFAIYLSHGDDAAIEFMKNNYGMGKDQHNLILRTFENVAAGLLKGYQNVKDTVLGPFQAIGGVATGLIGFLRLTLTQMTSGLSLATGIQRQTNHLNRAFNDSIYYHAGRNEEGRVVNPMLYYADNPFTREYAEPVVEVREPFQRLHMMGSFQHILDNSVIQSITDVSTVVTATSNGQHPVTVHFDKGAPAEKQTETVVDTGLFYDHPKGWLGTKRFFNPVEWSRQGAMALSGTNMETTAKRVALSHLKRNLQDIYDGYVTVIGDAKIRPHDLVFLGDVYCQPPGTMVSVVEKNGNRWSDSVVVDIPIEELSEGQRVVSMNIRNGTIHRRGKEITGLSINHFEGDLIKAVSTSGLTSRYTPGHRCIVKFDNALTNKWVVYLMEKGGKYRVGMTNGVRTTSRSGGSELTLGLAQRMQMERANKGWILSVHENKEDAAVAEVVTSMKFGLPQTCFVGDVCEEVWSALVHSEGLGQMQLKARMCLESYGLDIRYPLRSVGQMSSVAKTSETYAANLLDGMLMRREDGSWESVVVSREPYSGPVYSMDVADDETYVADGLFTHNSRMYGFFEVEEVVHHFTPETGFITTVKPNACVSINDPARFMLISRLRGQQNINSLREVMRHQLKVYADEANEGDLGRDMPDMKEMTIEDIIDGAEIQIRNSLQYTAGNSAIVKSIASMGMMGGLVGNAVGAAAANPVGMVAGVLGWKAWKWVRDNLLDQQGCYVQYLTQNGRPMDAGLSYNSGVAVGQQNVKAIVVKGLKLGEIPVLGPRGSGTIQTQEVIPLIQWDETGPNEHAQAVSLFVDRTNAEVRRIAGHEGLPGGFDTEVYWVRITRVIDGDTFQIRVLGQMKFGEFSSGSFVLGNGRVRPAGFDAPEDDYKHRTALERNTLYADDQGVRATEFARSLLMPGGQGLEVAIRIDEANRTDRFGRTLGYIFHRAPTSLTGVAERRDFILNAASRIPPINYDSYMEDGQPYTFDWEMIAAGHGKVFTNDMKRNRFNQGVTGGG